MATEVYKITERTAEEKELREMILQQLRLDQFVKDRTATLKDQKQNTQRFVANFLSKLGKTAAVIETPQETINLTLKKERKLKFDGDKLRDMMTRRGDAEHIQKVLTREIHIDSYPEVVKLLKRYGVPAEEFKKLITCHYTVNKKELTQHIAENPQFRTKYAAALIQNEEVESIVIKGVEHGGRN